MRQIGTLPRETDARRFADFLLTEGIPAEVNADEAGWAVWVVNEDDVAHARRELEQFRAHPDSAEYDDVEKVAATLRYEDKRRADEARQRAVNMRDRWNRSASGQIPVTVALLTGMALVGVLTMAGSKNETLIRALLIDSHVPPPFFFDVAHGQFWRLVTPIFLHGDILHLLFNAYWLFALGAMMEQLRGSGRLLVFVLAAAVLSNVAQYVIAGPGFGGMSGVNYALFGYIWMKSRYEPESGFYIDPTTVFILVGWFFLGVAGIIGGIANVAHAGGLIIGMVIGYAGKFWRDLNR